MASRNESTWKGQNKESALATASRPSRDSRTSYLKSYLCSYCGRWHLSSHPDWCNTRSKGEG